MEDPLPPRPAPNDTEPALLGGPIPLIRSKIQVPRRRPDLLARPRLVNLLHVHLDRRLTLISAPAGYGKTTLLTELAHDIDLPVCWYTLDPFDLDVRVFIEYLIASIARRFPGFGHRTHAFLRGTPDPGSNLYPIVATLVQEIYDSIQEYFVLILDDHHTVENQEQITEFLDLFLTYVDENCRLILASRTLPSLPSLSLLVARRQAAGLSIDELRFTAQEIQALARQNHHLELEREQAEMLAQRTGGWITGLMLTAVQRWQESRQVPLRGRISVDLYDYLSRQVLDQQPPPLREFMLASSVLDELNPDMCAAVLGSDDVTTLIDEVRQRNLFVTEYEGNDRWLRYHDLFREFLHSSLQRQSDVRFRDLTRRAAQAYASCGEWERAVGRYLALHEYEPVVEIIERTGASLYDSGRWDTLAGWIDALPSELRRVRPGFLVYRGKIYAERGDYPPALTLLAGAQSAFREIGDIGREALTVATKGSVLRLLGQYQEAIDHSQQVLALVSGSTRLEQSAMALATKNLGLCHISFGRLAQGRETLQQALLLYEALGDDANVAMVQHDLGLGYERAGDLGEAVVHYQAALQSWKRIGSPGPWANTLNGLGVVFYLQGKYDEALSSLNEALAKVLQAGDLRVQAYTCASLGDVHRDLGAYARAREAYNQALEIARTARNPFIITYAQDALGNVCRLMGDRTQARRHLLRAMEQAQANRSPYETALCHTSLGVLAGGEGDLVAAGRHLDQAVESLEASGFLQELGRARAHRAYIRFQAGQRRPALNDLEATLGITAKLGLDQFLVVEGQLLVPLLRFALKQGVGWDALPHLLERIEAHRALLAARPEPALQADAPPSLRIYGLGQARVDVNGQTVQWPIAQCRDLFHLLLEHPNGLRRERIGEILWPDRPPQKVNGLFRSTLYRLRRALFRDSILLEADSYRFNRSCVYWHDVEAFESLLDRAKQSADPQTSKALLEEAVVLYRGDYLDGIYADWPALERERLRGRFLIALETLAQLHAETSPMRAIELFQRLLAQDRYREATHRQLMLCQYRLGDRAAAIRQYQVCADILREDLGLSPSAETENVYLQIIG
jgi:LuxR family maltose regulon positive regulatory protein